MTAPATFCKEKLALLKRQTVTKRHEATDYSKDISVEKDIERFKWPLERLKIENLTKHLQTSHQSANIHAISSCEECRKKNETGYTLEFLRRKLQILEESEVQRRYNRHLTERTSVMLIADIIKDSVKPNASKNEVWKKFFKAD